MKPPMKTKMTGSENDAKAVRTGTMRRITASTGPSMAVTASGSASVTQNTTIMASTPASLWAGAGIGSGAAIRATSSSGPRYSPIGAAGC
jgi:hypothetical protein